MRPLRVPGISLSLLIVLVSACGTGHSPIELSRAPTSPTVVSTTAAPTADVAPVAEVTVPVDTTAPAAAVPTPTVTTAAPATTAAPPSTASTRGAWSMAPYEGFGAWLDAFDWSVAFARSPDHVVGVDAIDHMAAEGVQTLYIQTSRWNSETDVLEPERLQSLIDRAHGHGMAVISWYLPTLVDPATDLRRILANAALDVDGIAIDIEALDVEDAAERSRRMVDLSAAIRAALPGKVIGGIVLEPVVMEDVNPNYWPGYPWAEMAPYYDVWLPMGYWTNRRGEWRDAERYTAVNIDRIRERLGDPNAIIHAIGGIGDKTTVADLDGMVRAASQRGAIGGSIYDYRTTTPEFWATLRAFVRS